MYNKTKYLFDKVGGILALVVGALLLADKVLLAISLFNKCGIVIQSKLGIELYLEALFQLTLGIVLLLCGIKTIARPSKEVAFVSHNISDNSFTKNYHYEYSGELSNILLVVASATMAIINLSGIIGYAGSRLAGLVNPKIIVVFRCFTIVQTILFFSILILKAIAICIRDNRLFNDASEVLPKGIHQYGISYKDSKFLTGRIGAIFAMIVGVLMAYIGVSSSINSINVIGELTEIGVDIEPIVFIGLAIAIVIALSGLILAIFGMKVCVEPRKLITQTESGEKQFRYVYPSKAYGIVVVVASLLIALLLIVLAFISIENIYIFILFGKVGGQLVLYSLLPIASGILLLISVCISDNRMFDEKDNLIEDEVISE